MYLSANAGDPLVGAVSFQGNVGTRYLDGKEADRPNNLESSVADKTSCADYRGVLPMMITVKRRLARK